MVSGVKFGARLDKWLDEWKMALTGLMLATSDWKFDVTVVLTFVIFGTLMSLLSSSTAALNLFWATDAAGKATIIRDSFLALFGVGHTFTDWILLFGIAILQSILIGLVVFVWRKKRKTRRDRIISGVQNADNVQSVGLVAGLAVLGSGCPTCGTTLLMPVVGTIFSSGGYMLAGILSGILTVGAVVLALFTLKRIGKDAYVMIKSESFAKRYQKNEE